MKIGYETERLHHGLHPLFLNIEIGANWYVGKDDEEGLWYFSESRAEGDECQRFHIRNPQGDTINKIDLYSVKRYIYDYYKLKQEIQLPWGIISGIRPTKLARQIYFKNPHMDITEFQQKIWRLDRVSPQKANLLWQVLKVENQYLYDFLKLKPQNQLNFDTETIDLYIGVPFCPSRCYYCSFSAGVVKQNDDKLGQYVQLLEKELESLKPLWQNKKIGSIYIGGGTPTVLPENLLEKLLVKLTDVIDTRQVQEFTVEAGRPDTITIAKLDLLKQYRVKRISINPQSFSNDTLKKIGRGHSIEQIYNVYNLARERGFIINMDLIFGLNGENIENVKYAYTQIAKLNPDNVTVHTLTPKRGADLSEQAKQNIAEGSQSIGEMLDYWHEQMMGNGWRPYYLYRQKNIYYENVGYSKEGAECIYNIETMLERRSLVALGAGAISKKVRPTKITRYDMPKELMAYEKAVDEKAEKKLNFFMEVE